MSLDHLKVFCGNIGGDDNPPLGKIIDDHHPHVLLVVEAKHARSYLHDLADRKRYRHKQPTADNYGEEAPDIAVLIDKTIELYNHDVMKMDEPWWYNDKKRKPRRYQRMHLEGGWRLMAVHFPPGGPSGGGSKTDGRNKAAWMESRDRIKRKVRDWYDDAPHDAVLVVGDFNGTHDEIHHHLAEPLDMGITTYGKVNHAVRKRAKQEAVHKMNSNAQGHGWGWSRHEHG